MFGAVLFCFVIGAAAAWFFVSYEFRQVLLAEDREIFGEILQASRTHPFFLPSPWVEFAESVERKSTSNPRLRRAAARLVTVYRGLRAVILLTPAFVLLCILFALVVSHGI